MAVLGMLQHRQRGACRLEAGGLDPIPLAEAMVD
jgi:hypothetical protein